VNNRITAQSLLMALLAVVLLVATRPAPAGARDSGPAADGSGLFTFQGETTFFSFRARGHKRARATGRAHFTNLTAGTDVEVKIDCMNSDGSSASFRGVVKRSNDPDLPEGSAVVFAAVDWDALDPAHPDEITPLFPFTMAAQCDETPFPLTILPVDGDITVRP
jgi:hypothetical protein